MKIRLSVDDGCASDVRIAELCDKYGIECIFYWPVEWHSLAHEHGYEPLNFDDAFDIAMRFEIGSHTITHRHLTKLPEHEAEYEIISSSIQLENLFDTDITKFAPPRGYTNKHLTGVVHEFYQEQRLTKGEHLVHIHPNSGANGNKPWRECITDKTTELWGHSWEWDKYDMWREIEEWMRAYTSS